MSTPPFRRRTDSAPSEPTPLRALIVDDDENYRAYVVQVARRFGFASVLQASDGAEALVVMRDNHFDILIIDCEMPRCNGLDLIAAVRAQDRHADVYAVMLTARDDVETKISALRLGFDDYILKSSSELEIAAKLSAARRLVTRQRRLDSAVRELYGLATRDELTGLFNRRYFFGEAERMLEEGTVINLVLFDLDDFKQINDTYGHLAGDRILRDVGALFLRRTRHEDLIARYGGDEFVMLVPHLGPPEVEGLSGRLAADLYALQWTFGLESISVAATTGYACSSLMESPSLSRLLGACDRDLYKNKWVRKHPDVDPSLYEYPQQREASVIELEEEGEERKTSRPPNAE